MRRITTVGVLILMQLGIIIQAQENTITNVFQKGEEGYSCFRIPAIIQSKSGTLLAFAEARKNSCSDTGDIDLVVKRSEDGGQNWSHFITIWDDYDNVCGNPAPIVVQETGRIVLLSTWNPGNYNENQIKDNTEANNSRRVFVLYSDDDGRSWSFPKEITSTTKLSDWSWYATGPCHGIQLQKKNHKGRLVVSANHITLGTKETHSHVIYSDDLGVTWNLGGIVSKPGGNESSVVELRNGDLMLNMRNYNRKESKSRSYSISKDGGETLSEMKYISELIEPVCQGNILNRTKRGKITSVLLFSNPASIDKREKMTIRLSKDNGKTWPYSQLIYLGPSAYSDLVNLKDGNVGLLFEYGEKDPYEKIGFIKVPVEKFER